MWALKVLFVASVLSPDELRGSDSDAVGAETVLSCPQFELGDANGLCSSESPGLIQTGGGGGC